MPEKDRAAGSVDEIDLGDRFAIAPQMPLPHLDGPGSVAVAARDLRRSERPLYALIHSAAMPQRGSLAAALMAEPIVNLAGPVAQDIVRIAKADAGARTRDAPERLVSLVSAPEGPSLASAAKPKRLGLDALRRGLIPSALQALGALHARGFTHRALRPATIFETADPRRLTFGEPFSGPPGAGQPAAYEPLEEAMAEPYGRGSADPTADLYALGVTLLACHLGRDPGERIEPETLMAARIDKGSYYALTGGAEISGTLDPALRGLLADDPALRWTLSDLAAWADHGVVRQRAPVNTRHLSRPVRFNGASYSDRCKLAASLGSKPMETAAHLSAREPEAWIAGAFPAKTTDERMMRLLNLPSAGNERADRTTAFALTARICAFIDPAGPIRFGGAALMPGGLGTALAHAFANKDHDGTDLLGKLFASGMLPTCLEIKSRLGHGNDLLAFRIGDAARIASDPSAGAGLERALYCLSPETPCLSPAIEGFWASTPRRLVEALEAAAAETGPLTRLLDRHVLAYLAAHMDGARSYVAQTANALARETDGTASASASLALLAFLQRKLCLGPLCNLSARIGEALAPPLQQIKSRTRREGAQRRLNALAKTGDLERVRASVDVAALIAEDARGFAAAQGRVQRLLQQRHRLSRPTTSEDRDARSLGYSLAAGLGWLALLATAGVLTIGGLA